MGLLGLGVVASRLEAAHQHLQVLHKNPKDYRLQFFSPPEDALLDRVAEMIIPADERSPGAHAAHVSYYIDLVAAHSSDAAKAEWKSRLAAFDQMVRHGHGKPFIELDEKDRAALLDKVSANENHPASPAEHFFVEVKKATLFGYYTSEIGLLQELGYKGNEALGSFPGCTHPAGKHS